MFASVLQEIEDDDREDDSLMRFRLGSPSVDSLQLHAQTPGAGGLGAQSTMPVVPAVVTSHNDGDSDSEIVFMGFGSRGDGEDSEVEIVAVDGQPCN